MELYQARDNFIIQHGYYSLWCNRLDGGIFPRQGVPPSEAFDPVCKGLIYGVIGKIQLFPGAEWKLLVITKKTFIGLLHGNHEAYRIDRIAVLPLAQGEVPDLELDLCEKHQSGGRPKKLLGGGDGQQKGLQQTWKNIKSAATNIKDNVKSTNTPREVKDREKEKLEKRLLEETLKMFNDSESFIYSPTGDITNTLQRQCGEHYDSDLPLWKRVDERFFWNRYMLQDLINNEDPLCTKWILPIIQGYCQIVHCVNKFEEDEPDELVEIQRGTLPPEEFDLLLISRRSIHRAGTRYKRRGVDEDGKVANFVETEQIIRTEIHSVSFVQVRGSVPIYWSQPGFKYRPPPRLDKDEEETQMAFMSHFAHQLKYYGGVVIINLIDQTGREKIIGDAFMDNILAFNSPLLTYITFDFHEYCRGMKFENVSILVGSILDVLKDMRYCWTDSKGIICEQLSVFRVNCMDCLDRTNVVQAALARHVMEVQLRKLGKLLPDQPLPAEIRSSFQEMWANHGDAISRQYAGTAAMKGDFTRTGERKFTGVMKDGYNSANRYYLNRFKAVYRQTVIDAMLGNPLTEDLTAAMAALKNGDEEDPWTMEREECVAQLVIHCQFLLLSETEECIGGWALVDPFYSPEGELNQDQDVILLLTYDAYYVASYDDDAERITQYERIIIENVDKIEIGFEPSFKNRYLFIRIHYKLQNNSGYYHTLRTIQHRTPEEAKGVLLGIAEAFNTARSAKSLSMKIIECKLDKKKSKSPPDIIQISSKSRLSGWSKPKTKVKNKHDLESFEDESGLSSKLHAKENTGKLKSMLKHHLASIPRPYSDPCLTRQDVDGDYQVQRKRSGTSSAPLSSASSSSSDSESGETEDASDQLAAEILAMRAHQDRLEKEFAEKLKPAKNLECRSEETLFTKDLAVTKETGKVEGLVTSNLTVTKDTGEVEGLVTSDLTVTKDTEQVEGLVSSDLMVTKDTGEEEVLVTSDLTVAKDTGEEGVLVTSDLMVTKDTGEEEVLVTSDLTVAKDTGEEGVLVTSDLMVTKDTGEEEVLVTSDLTVAKDTGEEGVLVTSDLMVTKDTGEEEVLVTSDLMVTKDTEEVEGLVTSDLTITRDTEGDEVLVTSDLTVSRDTEGEGVLDTKEQTVTKNPETEEEGLVSRESTVNKDAGIREDKNEVISEQKQGGFAHERTAEVMNDVEAVTEEQNSIHSELNLDSENSLDSLKSSTRTEENNSHLSDEECKIENELQNQLQESEGKVNELTEINEKNYDKVVATSDTSDKQTDNLTDETGINLEDISEIKESYYESKKKFKHENLLDFSTDDAIDAKVQNELTVSPSPTVRLGLGGNFRSFAVSFKSKSSTESSETCIGELDAETSDKLTSTEDKTSGNGATSNQGFNRFRFSSRSLGGRNSNTTSSAKSNLFASAQARGRTLLPDLRNKLSSISFSRPRSPRLTHKQHTVDSEAVVHHKRHKHKHKCLTRIIEL